MSTVPRWELNPPSLAPAIGYFFSILCYIGFLFLKVSGPAAFFLFLIVNGGYLFALLVTFVMASDLKWTSAVALLYLSVVSLIDIWLATLTIQNKLMGFMFVLTPVNGVFDLVAFLISMYPHFQWGEIGLASVPTCSAIIAVSGLSLAVNIALVRGKRFGLPVWFALILVVALGSFFTLGSRIFGDHVDWLSSNPGWPPFWWLSLFWPASMAAALFAVWKDFGAQPSA